MYTVGVEVVVGDSLMAGKEAGHMKTARDVVDVVAHGTMVVVVEVVEAAPEQMLLEAVVRESSLVL